jgi:hypothetical protein
MAVNRVDSVLTKKLYESVYAARVDGPPQSKNLRRNARSAKKISKPSAPVCGPDWNDGVASFAELLREAEDHHLRASRPVRLEHHSDSKT